MVKSPPAVTAFVTCVAPISPTGTCPASIACAARPAMMSRLYLRKMPRSLANHIGVTSLLIAPCATKSLVCCSADQACGAAAPSRMTTAARRVRIFIVDFLAPLIACSMRGIRCKHRRMARHPSLIALSHDHHHGLALALRCRKQALGRLKPMGAAGLKERAAEFAGFFNQNLTRHFKAEEEILFPFMRASIPESSALIDDLLADHARLRALLAPLAGDTGLAEHLFDAGDLF